MIKFLDPTHKLFSIAPLLRVQFEQAQANLLHNEFEDAAALVRAACAAIRIEDEFTDGLVGQPVLPFADQSRTDLLAFFDATADKLALPEEVKSRILPLLVNRVQFSHSHAKPSSTARRKRRA